MRHGMSPSAAAEDALRRILKYYPKFEGALVAVNKVGDYGEFVKMIVIVTMVYIIYYEKVLKYYLY